MKDNIPHTYRIGFLTPIDDGSGEIILGEVEMDWSDEAMILFSRGYGDIVAMINKSSVKYVIRCDEDDH